MARIALSPVKWGDAPELIVANRLSRDYHAPWVEPFTDETGFNAWVAATLTTNQVSLIARCAITGGIVGVFNISQIVLGRFQSAFLGFYGMAEFAGRGLMTEALNGACDHALTHLSLHRLEANVQPGNERSIKLIKRCGFQYEGFSPRYLYINGAWADHERWARLANEP